MCGDAPLSPKDVAEDLRAKRGFYPLIFDGEALRSSRKHLHPLLSFREFFLRAPDAIAVVELEWNVVRWTSASIGTVAYAPYFGVAREKGRLRVGLIGQDCH